LVLLGHAVGGRITSDRLNEVSAAYQCLWATSCDPACGVDELGETLADVSVLRRRVALVIARERGAAVRALLPVLADMLHAPQPRQHLPQWTAGGIGPALQISLDDEIHRLAAEAILAVAAPDDPLVAEARGVLADAPSGGR
jgi:hypothetical protein